MFFFFLLTQSITFDLDINLYYWCHYKEGAVIVKILTATKMGLKRRHFIIVVMTDFNEII